MNRPLATTILSLFFALSAGLLPALAEAVGETYYVSDELVIGAFDKPDLKGQPKELLRTGAPLQVIERTSQAAKVRLPKGAVAWVDSTYLVSDKPDAVRLLVLQDENAQLRADIESMEARLQVSEEHVARLKSRLPREEGDEAYVDPQTLRLMEENMDLKKRISVAGDALGIVEAPPVQASPEGYVSGWWVLAGVAIALLLGFVIGLRWLDRSIRRRHGGFRV